MHTAEMTIHLGSIHAHDISKAASVEAYTQMALPPIHLQRVFFSLISYLSFVFELIILLFVFSYLDTQGQLTLTPSLSRSLFFS